MVHCYCYDRAGKKYNFLWDVESGSLHIVDYPAFLCAKKRYSDLTPDEEKDFSELPDQVKAEIAQELDGGEEAGVLNAKPLIDFFVKSTKVVKALCLHICHDCNLNCEYCFAGGGNYNTEKDYMSEETGRRAVDFLIQNSGKRKNLEIDFFGGEPLLNMKTVKEVVRYAREIEEKYDKKFAFTMTTNCLLLNDENIAWLNENMEKVVLSIDGRKCTHNAVRHTRSGKDSYDIILKNAQKFRAVRGDKKYYVRATFTAKNLDFCDDILSLNDAGFDQISAEPVVLSEDSPMALREEHLDAICKEYEKFTEKYLERRKEGGKHWFNFFHFMIDLEHGPCPDKRLTGCGAGTEYMAVSPLGELYPCHRFVGGDEKYRIGSVYTGIENPSVRDDFAKLSVLSKPHCKECFAKYNCGGGCTANAIQYAGKPDAQYKMGCELTKKRLECSLAIAAIEKTENK